MITTIAHMSNHLHLHLTDFALGLILGVVIGLSILTFIGRSRKS